LMFWFAYGGYRPFRESASEVQSPSLPAPAPVEVEDLPDGHKLYVVTLDQNIRVSIGGFALRLLRLPDARNLMERLSDHWSAMGVKVYLALIGFGGLIWAVFSLRDRFTGLKPNRFLIARQRLMRLR